MTQTTAKHLLHAHSLKVTKPRIKILKYLMTHHNHPTVDIIYNDLNKTEHLNKATIYNTLKTLISVGIVIEIKNGDSSSHYDYFVQPHFHIICKKCGAISDVFYPHFAQVEDEMCSEAEHQTGFITTSSHLEIYGLCPKCQKTQGQK